VLARGTATGNAVVRVRITATGRRALRKRARTVRLRAVWTPHGGTAATIRTVRARLPAAGR
jgi:hypothetical protein